LFFLKKIYDWVLSLSDKKNSDYSISLLSFFESFFFPIPPDVLLIPLCLGNRSKSFYYAFLCSISSIIGGIIGYYIGKILWWSVPDIEYSALAKLFFQYVPGLTFDSFDNIKKLYEQWNFWIVFTAGFTPIPFKLITISSGTFNINFFMFLIASIISRSARFFLLATLLWFFGEKIRFYIEKYFNLLAILFTILLIGGFIIIKLVLE
tara:strand:+ start:3662 stop:4282 length:621 start_codon:yes stop_codon:yes gene_type:complete